MSNAERIEEQIPHLSFDEQLEYFFTNELHSKWIRDGDIRAYVRRTQRSIKSAAIVFMGGEPFNLLNTVDSLDIADFELPDNVDTATARALATSKTRDETLEPWRKFISKAYTMTPLPIIHVGNMNDPRILAWCKDNSWNEDRQGISEPDYPSSYYIELPQRDSNIILAPWRRNEPEPKPKRSSLSPRKR